MLLFGDRSYYHEDETVLMSLMFVDLHAEITAHASWVCLFFAYTAIVHQQGDSAQCWGVVLK